MGSFEAACWNWYQETVNSFTVKGGVLGELVRSERLSGAAKRLFIRAVGLIDEMGERVGMEKARALKQAGG